MFLNISQFWRVGGSVCSGKGERLGYERSGFDDSGLRAISFSVAKVLSITVQNGQKFSQCLKNGRSEQLLVL